MDLSWPCWARACVPSGSDATDEALDMQRGPDANDSAHCKEYTFEIRTLLFPILSFQRVSVFAQGYGSPPAFFRHSNFLWRSGCVFVQRMALLVPLGQKPFVL